MKLEITEKKESPLLKRTEVYADLQFDAQTPSTAEVKKQLSSSLKADENLVVVKNIYTSYGRRQASVSAYLYNDEDSLKKIEPKIKEKKGAKKTEAKEESEQKPETKEKTEEKQEEKKSEEKAESKEEPQKAKESEEKK